jgi:tetratricopeptide (TPR) repeat protein
VLLLDSRWQPAYLYRGLAHLNRGEYQQALSDDTAALNLKSDDPTAHNNLAWLYATAKDEKIRNKDKALEHAKQAAMLSHEGNTEILDTLATAYAINGKLQEALATEHKAVQRDPNDQEFKAHLAAYQDSGVFSLQCGQGVGTAGGLKGLDWESGMPPLPVGQAG